MEWKEKEASQGMCGEGKHLKQYTWGTLALCCRPAEKENEWEKE
jgi:hypothetical protein